MIKKRLARAIFCFLALTILLLGCEGKASERESSPASSKFSEKLDAGKETVSLRIGVAGVTLNGMDELAKSYELQNPHIKITVERAPDEQYESGLLAGLAGHDAPDIFEYWGGIKNMKLAAANYMEDLSKLQVISRIDAKALRPFSFNNKINGIPFSYEFLGVYYNKNTFQANGWEIPTNWDEFMKLMENIKLKGLQPIIFMGQEVWAVQLPWYQMAPTIVYSKDNEWDQERFDNKVKFATSNAWKEMAEKYNSLLINGYLGENILSIDYEQAKQVFFAGKAAMIIDGSWSLSNYKEMARQGKMNIGMFAFPANAPGQEQWLAKSTSAGLSIWSGSKHKEEAKKFYEFIMSDANLVQLIGEGNISSSTTLNIKADPIFADIMPAVNNNKFYPFLDIVWPLGPQEEALMKETQSVLGGTSTFGNVLEIADKAWDEGTVK